jgi:hypothetical protein
MRSLFLLLHWLRLFLVSSLWFRFRFLCWYIFWGRVRSGVRSVLLYWCLDVK